METTFDTAPNDRLDSPRIAAGTAAALAAAVVGGVLWGFIVKSTDYEVGIVAWAVGWLAGTAAVLVGRGRGLPLQLAAVAAALIGILLGKYLSFAFVVQELAERDGVSLGLFSGDMQSLFRDQLGEVFGLFDVLWVGFAVFTAWRVPMRHEPELPPALEPRGVIE